MLASWMKLRESPSTDWWNLDIFVSAFLKDPGQKNNRYPSCMIVGSFHFFVLRTVVELPYCQPCLVATSLGREMKSRLEVPSDHPSRKLICFQVKRSLECLSLNNCVRNPNQSCQSVAIVPLRTKKNKTRWVVSAHLSNAFIKIGITFPKFQGENSNKLFGT